MENEASPQNSKISNSRFSTFQKSEKSLRGTGLAGLALAVFGVILLPDVAGAQDASATTTELGEDIVITFEEDQLIDARDGSTDATETFEITEELAGTYEVTVFTHDSYDGRENTKQENESVIFEVNYFDTIIVDDLEDGLAAADGISETKVVNLKAGDVVRLRHGSTDGNSPNSVHVTGVILTPYSVPTPPPVTVPEPVEPPVEEILPEPVPEPEIDVPITQVPEQPKPAKPTEYTEATLPVTGTGMNILLGMALSFLLSGTTLVLASRSKALPV